MERGMREDNDLLIRQGRGGKGGKAELRHALRQADGARRRLSVDAALRERIEPVLVEVLRMARPPLALEIVLEGAGLAGQLENDVAARAGVEDRLDDGLLQRRDAGARPAGAPLLQRMVIGQDQVARGGRLVHVGGETDLVADLAERLLERAGE